MNDYSKNKLSEAYDTENFRNIGHQLIDLLADHINAGQQRKQRVISYKTPAESLAYWQADLKQKSKPIDFFQNLLAHSINLQHPHYIGHQVAVPALVSSFGGLISDLLNNGTGVYEMGMASNAMEKIVTDWLAHQIGFGKKGGGFLTSGGTLANLTALLAARKSVTQVWEKGNNERLAVMVSEQAHYCIDRAARILGMGEAGIIKIPTDDKYKIRTDLLEEYYQKAQADGLKVIAVVGSACSTSTGSYDDLEALADFCKKYSIWLHVDGAHGSAVVVSKKYRYLVKGIEKADSITIDFHKMMMTPALNTALMFKNGIDAYKTFQQEAAYLWEVDQAEEWYHSGKRTFECTKLMMSLKVYAIMKIHGTEIFELNVNQLYDNARVFAKMIIERPNFELAIEPEANIVNFQYTPADSSDWNILNATIRQKLLEKGNFYIVQTILRGQRYLRTTVMNPLTTIHDFQNLLDEIEQL